MLQTMQQPTASEPAPSSSNFASLLAALATPAQSSSRAPGDRSKSQGWTSRAPSDRSMLRGKKPLSAWDDDGLEDDIATLSYERALRANARYHPAPAEQPFAQAATPEPIHFENIPSAASVVPLAAEQKPETDHFHVAPPERNLKDASITIRVSKAECEQLHRRAAEAGLTVSAYLRSCTFEAESLRAMVKDTLAQLRSATTEAKPPAPESSAPDCSRFRRIAGRLARWPKPRHGSQSVDQA